MTVSSGRSLRLAFGIALLAALVWVVGPRELGRTLASAHPGWLGAAFALYAVMVAVKAYRWLTVVALQQLELPWKNAVRAYGLGMLLGAVTPGRIGQHVKAMALVERGAPLERALATTIVDQLLDMLVVTALVPVAVGYFGVRVSGSAWLGLASVLLAAAGVWVLTRWGKHRFAAAAAEAWRLGRRALGRPLALAAVSTGLYFLTLGAAGRGVGIGLGVVPLALASVASAVVEIAPITVAGLGTREAALLAILRPLGVQAPAVLAFTLVIRALQVALGAIAWAAGRGRFRGLPAGSDREPGRG